MEEDNKDNVVKITKAEDYEDDSDDCYEIDPICISFTRKLIFDELDDVAIIADKGPVALRDFPHPRHLCGNYPFNRTSHESYCSKCFCYVCEVAAPCLKWSGVDGHCNISTKPFLVSSSRFLRLRFP